MDRDPDDKKTTGTAAATGQIEQSDAKTREITQCLEGWIEQDLVKCKALFDNGDVVRATEILTSTVHRVERACERGIDKKLQIQPSNLAALYFSRGVCYERLCMDVDALKDVNKALKVSNYMAADIEIMKLQLFRNIRKSCLRETQEGDFDEIYKVTEYKQELIRHGRQCSPSIPLGVFSSYRDALQLSYIVRDVKRDSRRIQFEIADLNVLLAEITYSMIPIFPTEGGLRNPVIKNCNEAIKVLDGLTYTSPKISDLHDKAYLFKALAFKSMPSMPNLREALKNLQFIKNRTSNVTQEDADCSRMLRALEDQQKAQQNEEMQEWIAASNQKEIARGEKHRQEIVEQFRKKQGKSKRRFKTRQRQVSSEVTTPMVGHGVKNGSNDQSIKSTMLGPKTSTFPSRQISATESSYVWQLFQELATEATSKQMQISVPTRRKRSVDNHMDWNNDEIQRVVCTLPWPLNNGKYDVRLACDACLPVIESTPCQYTWEDGMCGGCKYDILIVKKKDETSDCNWVQIRDINRTCSVKSRYIMCKYHPSGEPSDHSVMQCGYCHSEEELICWNKELQNEFNISDFKSELRNAIQSIKLRCILRKYTGELTFLCEKCFHLKPSVISKKLDDIDECENGHRWIEYGNFLVHVKHTGEQVHRTPIRLRPKLDGKHGKVYHRCADQYCSDCDCKKAHSEIEKDIWQLETDNNWERSNLVIHIRQLDRKRHRSSPSASDAFETRYDKEMQVFSGRLQRSGSVASICTSPTDVKALCDYDVEFYCRNCFKVGTLSGPNYGLNYCELGKHVWTSDTIICIYISSADKKKDITVIRNMPTILKDNFELCRHENRKGSSCKRGNCCTFAHSQPECDVWNWMKKNDVYTLDQLVQCSKRYKTQHQKFQEASKKNASDSRKCPTLPNYNVGSKRKRFYCSFCDKDCNSSIQYEQHCTGSEHKKIAMIGDQMESPWCERPPPLGEKHECLKMCEMHSESKMCEYSGVDGCNNYCPYAHTKEELNEWHQRYLQKRARLKFIKESNALSPVDSLYHDYLKASRKSDIIVDTVEGVTVNTEGDLKQLYGDKETSNECDWKFQVHVVDKTKALKKVALLSHRHRDHFDLIFGNLNEQMLSADQVCTDNDEKTYEFTVKFKTCIYGSFSQWVILDFGEKPVLGFQLQVQVGCKAETHSESIKEETFGNIGPVSPLNDDDIHYMNQSRSKFARLVAEHYKEPVWSENTLSGPLNESSYCTKMHSMLKVEEQTQRDTIQRCKITSKVFVDKENKCPDLFTSSEESMYGKIELREQVDWGGHEGKLLLSNANKVIVQKPGDTKGFEVESHIHISPRNDAGMGKSLCLYFPAECCKRWNLKGKTTMDLIIRFQLDELKFQAMHLALDNFREMNLLFPDKIQEVNVPMSEALEGKLKTNLSKEKNQIMSHLLAKRTGYKNVPPTLVVGAFGSGKTFTFLKTVPQIVENDTNSKILICTQHYSAASAFFKELLKDKSLVERCYKLPRLEDSDSRYPSPRTIAGHQVVVGTLLSSLVLLLDKELNKHIRFSHIFIDEVAQALEPETLIPLTLANKDTMVAFAGDQMQINPYVYDKSAIKEGLHCTLLQRLYNFYSRDCSPNQRHPYQFLLTENFRSVKPIVSFVSKMFYRCALIHKRKREPDFDEYPLQFYMCNGNHEPERPGSLLYNQAEADELADCVTNLQKQNITDFKIAIVAPYREQVKMISDCLTKRGILLNENLVVDRVENVQGMEFNALLISPVHTRDNAERAKTSVGFFNDIRLLNTAFTRAKDLILAVGDPVALCMVGKCAKIWEEFLFTCIDNGGAFPSHLNKNWLTEQLQIQNDLNGISDHEDTPSQYAASDISGSKGTKDSGYHSGTLDSDSDNVSRTSEDGYSSGPDVEDFIERHFEEKRNIPEHDEDITDGDDEDVKVSYVNDQEEGDDQPNILDQPYMYHWLKDRDLVGADDIFGDNCNSDDDDDDIPFDLLDTDDYFIGNTRPSGSADIYESKNILELQQLLKHEKDKYKLCMFYMHSPQMGHCIPLKTGEMKDDGQISRIEIFGRINCGQAYHESEVVVRVEKATDGTYHGKVVGVLSTVNFKKKQFVCSFDEYNINIMRPLCKTFPKFIIYNKQDGNKQNINIYTADRHGKLKQVGHRPANIGNKNKYLFVVQYLRWNTWHRYPLGVVVKALDPGTDMDSGLKILKIQYGLSRKYSSKVRCHTEQLHALHTKGKSNYSGRIDLTSLFTFTIDPPGTKDFDDALSIENTEEGLVLWVHVTDVSHYINIGDPLDIEARTRGSSFYPPSGKPYHMLPPTISEDVCSIVVDEVRPAISMKFSFQYSEKDGYNMMNVPFEEGFKLAVIKCKKRFSYEDVENLLSPSQIDASFDTQDLNTLKAVHSIAMYLARRRCINSWRRANEDDFPKAHLIIDECMILANKTAASELLRDTDYKQCTPMRVQQQPDDQALGDWKQDNESVIGASLHFERFKTRDGIDEKHIRIRSRVWEDIQEAAKRDPEQLKWLMSSEELHPAHSKAIGEWIDIQKPTRYVCGFTEGIKHYSLDCDYTQCTSPLRRYIDLVVQRLLKAKILRRDPPYKLKQIQEICEESNFVSRRSKQFNKDCKSLKFAVKLNTQPTFFLPNLHDIQEDGITVRIPGVHFIPRSCFQLGYGLLRLKTIPKISRPNECKETANRVVGTILELTWVKRLYDTRGPSTPHAQTDSSQKEHSIDPNRFTVEIPISVWKSIQNEFSPTMLKHFTPVPTNVHNTEVTSEVSQQVTPLPNKSKAKAVTKPRIHDCFIKLILSQECVLKLMFGAKLRRGFLQPFMRAINLTSSVDVCIEHKADPIGCFADCGAVSCMKEMYKSVENYQDTLQPILALECAQSAVAGNENFEIHHVRMKWKKCHPTSKEEYYGCFQLDSYFCRERNIKFECRELEEDFVFEDIDKNLSKIDTGQYYDYLCIRYNKKECHTAWDKGKFYPYTTDSPHWIGHGLTVCAHSKADSVKKIVFKLQNGDLPEDIFGRNQDEQPFTCCIEVIPKTLPDRRMEDAVQHLLNATPLAQEIATGYSFDDPNLINADYATVTDDWDDVEIKTLPKANAKQKEAILKALRNKFTLIQGPPGTGKSLTGVRLVYCLADRNRRSMLEGSQPTQSTQVMYCGPSNKSVDVVTAFLKEKLSPKFIGDKSKCPKLIRVYGEKMVELDFPVPYKRIVAERKTKRELDEDEGACVSECEHSDVALHHLIRKPPNTRAKELVKLDKLFKKYFHDPSKHSVTEQDIEMYERTVMAAEVEELKRHEVILCTCAVSSSPRIQQSTNIKQLIIDECGMCIETDSLIPIVSTRAEQVILIGDHKQLRPIVLNQMARDLGLETSLFERYASHPETVMLNIQYRMHKDICDFPSQYFYDGKLKSLSSRMERTSNYWKWKEMLDKDCRDLHARKSMAKEDDINDALWQEKKHIRFCHCKGTEEVQSVSTEDGNEQSRRNKEEADWVVRLFSTLVEGFKIDTNNIIVLSQYKAQVEYIRKELTKDNRFGPSDSIHVNTVVASQGGEWDYVIFSTVRSLPKYQIIQHPTIGWYKRNLGFICDGHQINVALTRARRGLIIFGNQNLLETHVIWKKLFEHYQENKCCIPAEEYFSSLLERTKRTLLYRELPPRFQKKFETYLSSELQTREQTVVAKPHLDSTGKQQAPSRTKFQGTRLPFYSTQESHRMRNVPLPQTFNGKQHKAMQMKHTQAPFGKRLPLVNEKTQHSRVFTGNTNSAGRLKEKSYIPREMLEDTNTGKSHFVHFVVDHRGYHAAIKELGVSLTIPEGAIKEGQSKHLYFGVSWEPFDMSALPKSHARASPVVVCGPHGTQFEKRVLLSFSHCIAEVHNATHSRKVWCSETPDNKPCHWKEVDSDETTVIFTDSKCVCAIWHFTKHTVSCESKVLRVAAFAEHSEECKQMQVSVYCIQDTQEEQQKLKEDIKGFNMMKVAPDECFIARMTCKCKSQSENEDDTAANITVSLKSAIWNVVKPSEQQQEIHLQPLKAGLRRNCHFILERSNVPQSSMVQFTVTVNQAGQGKASEVTLQCVQSIGNRNAVEEIPVPTDTMIHPPASPSQTCSLNGSIKAVEHFQQNDAESYTQLKSVPNSVGLSAKPLERTMPVQQSNACAIPNAASSAVSSANNTSALSELESEPQQCPSQFVNAISRINGFVGGNAKNNGVDHVIIQEHAVVQRIAQCSETTEVLTQSQITCMANSTQQPLKWANDSHRFLSSKLKNKLDEKLKDKDNWKSVLLSIGCPYDMSRIKGLVKQIGPTNFLLAFAQSIGKMMRILQFAHSKENVEILDMDIKESLKDAYRRELEWEKLRSFSCNITEDLDVEDLSRKLFSKKIINMQDKRKITKTAKDGCSERAASELIDKVLMCPCEKDPVKTFREFLKQDHDWLVTDLCVDQKEVERPFQEEMDDLIALRGAQVVELENHVEPILSA